MTTLIFLMALLALGIYLLNTKYDISGIIITVICSVFLILHCVGYFTASYNYEMFKTKRNSFEQTLQMARESGNPIETAAIIKDVSAWNQKLAALQYDNKTPFFNQYIDDRIESLKPIK